MALEWVWCPYCRKFEGCMKENGVYICPSKQRTFTEKQSNDDIRNR